jgi:protein phosphatase methylesterase 1
METLVADAVDAALEVVGTSPRARAVFLVGHSLGGATVTRLAASWPESLPPLRGLVLIESCEGSTLAALPSMRGIYRSQPRSFASEAEAASFLLESGASHAASNALVLVSPRLKEEADGRFSWRAQPFIDESMEDEETWRAWFEGTTAELLTLKLNSKLLVVSTREHLFNDRALTVALTQGKLQVLVLQRTGHSVHEDDPGAVAAALLAFFARACTVLPVSPTRSSSSLSV